MSKAACGQFVPQFTIDFLSGDVEQLEKIVKIALENKAVKIDSIERVNTRASVYLNFNVSGLNYWYRERERGTTTKPITTISVRFMREAGFSTYELLKELESQGKKDIEHADFIGYSATFWTDSSYRLYRHKKWVKLEGKNHYIYNDDIYSQEFIDDIGSYLINLIAMKGK